MKDKIAEITPMQAAKEACKSQIESTVLVDFDSDFNLFVEELDCYDTERWDKEFIKVIRATLNAYDGVK